MNPIEAVDDAAPIRARKGRRSGTLTGRLPRGDRRLGASPSLDPDLPVLLVRVGHYPIHHGTVGVIRTLGRVGVPVYAVIENGVTPASTSRYLTGRVRISSDGVPDQTKYLERLVEAIDRLPAKPLLVCTDDEAAVLVAEGAGVLADRAVCPAIAPDLPRASSPASMGCTSCAGGWVWRHQPPRTCEQEATSTRCWRSGDSQSWSSRPIYGAG